MINSKINVISIKDKNACVLLYVVLIVFCVFSLIFNHASLYSWTQTILFILIMTVMFLYIMFSKNITYIDPVLLFFVAIFLYEIPKLLWYLGFYSEDEVQRSALTSFNIKNVDYINGSAWYLIYTIIAMLIVLISSSLNIKFECTDRYYSLPNQSVRYFSYIIISFFVVVLFLASTDGRLLYFLSARQGDLGAKDLRDGLYFLTAISISMLYLFVYAYVCQVSRVKKAFLSLCFALISIIVFLITGSRGFIVYGVVSYFIYLINENGDVPWIKLIFLTIVIAMSFSVMGILRNIPIDSLSIDSIVLFYSENNDSQSLGEYQMQLRDELIFDRSDIIEPYYFDFIISPITSIIPKSVIGSFKMPMIDGVIAKDIWGRYDIGLPVNVTTEAFLSFKFMGFLLFIPLGIFLRLFYLYMVHKSNFVYVYIPIMILSQTFLTSKLFFVMQVAIIMVVFILINKLFETNA
ncbi:oligosaccharide repeat unit polymerase [Citrobacter freundii]|uniref:Oligosaccharide repeat unit polymerase n=1 Tax=Citrobacter freundii TaxID=546 RepID=A0AAE7GR22_CITFR|nr:O-antigen polymerase [Citrobacter freundii]QLO12772.1 oligosaccharide repeat unit polymerase [Citrobacter freundii]